MKRPSCLLAAPRRIDVQRIKTLINPLDFYQRETASMRATNQRTGWLTAGLCPFHDDTRPGSLKFNADTGRYRCYACDAHGDYFDFVCARYGMDFREAAEYLMREHGS